MRGRTIGCNRAEYRRLNRVVRRHDFGCTPMHLLKPGLVKTDGYEGAGQLLLTEESLLVFRSHANTTQIGALGGVLGVLIGVLGGGIFVAAGVGASAGCLG